jgi:soluble lytic murein transglycosylase-like protein
MMFPCDRASKFNHQTRDVVMTPRSAMFSTTALLALGAMGCASQGPKPTEELTRARAVIGQADKGTAQRYAAADLQRAHDELRDAEKASDAGRFDEARRYAESAEVDGDVAAAVGNAGDAKRAANEVQKGTDTLQSESDRNATPPVSR